MWRGKSDITPWATAAVLAIVAAQWLPGKWYIVIGGIAGALTPALQSVLKSRKNTPANLPETPARKPIVEKSK